MWYLLPEAGLRRFSPQGGGDERAGSCFLEKNMNPLACFLPKNKACAPVFYQKNKGLRACFLPKNKDLRACFLPKNKPQGSQNQSLISFQRPLRK
jgi:hypothetical protein